MTVQTNLPAEGHIGIEPPADAPREVSQGLTPAERAIPDHARGHEKELAPLTYGKGSAEVQTVGSGVQEATHTVEAPKAVEAAPGQEGRTYKTAEITQEFPAASNTDTPSRGIPGTAPIPKERKFAPLAVSGGFGEAEAEYFPLDGSELKQLVEGLMDEVHARIQNDLRFSVAITYPRLMARVQIVVEGETEDQNMLIEKVLPPNGKWDRTPKEEAVKHGDSVVFVVSAQRREFDEQDQSETPADAMRAELGIRAPRKHVVSGQGVNKMFTDVNW